MSNFAETTVNPGSGGAKIASDTFTQGADTVTLVYSGIAFGTLGGGSYQAVDATHGMPVNVVAGTVTVGAGSALIGQVELSDGSNTLGTSAHPVRTDPTGTTTQPVSGTVTVGNSTLAVTQSGTWSLAAHQSTNLDQLNGTTVDTNSGNKSAGTLRVVLATDQPQLSNTLKVDGSGVTQPVSIAGTVAVSGTFWQATQPVSMASLPALAGSTNNVGYFTPAPAGQTTGATPFHAVSAASNNATNLKSSAGTLWECIAINLNTSSPRYVKFYDVSGTPNPASDAVKYVVPLPTAGSANGAGAARQWPVGLKFSNGIGYAIVAGIGDTDNTAVAANEVMLSGSYQ